MRDRLPWLPRGAVIAHPYSTLSISIVFSLLVGFAQAASASSAKIGASAEAAVSRKGPVRVVVALQDTAPPGPQALSALRKRVDAAQDRVLSALTGSGSELLTRFHSVPGLVLRVERAGLDRLAAHPDVRRVDLDVGGSGSLASSLPVVKANQLHSLGITGAGVTVAVLDTGLDTDHDDLADDLVHQDCYLDEDGVINGVGGCPNGSDRQTGAGAAEDDAGHGTHTTGIITSAGSVSSVGVAPDAAIIAIKVMDDTGFRGSFTFFTEIVAALDHIIASHPEVQVINMSLGTSDLYTGNCDNSTSFNMLGAAAINTLRARGTIAFASSGNESSGTQMASPACLSKVVSVGATDDSGNVAAFTNSNITTDIMAPGVSITSDGLANSTFTGNGTSFASPHAAGCAALFIEQGSATTPYEIEVRLESSNVLVTDATNGLSFPRINCFDPPAPDPDTDGDGLLDGWELANGFDPQNPDEDMNGVVDGQDDADLDGLGNAAEVAAGTLFDDADSDDDGLSDGDEVILYATDPQNPDTDGDGAADGAEVFANTDPLDPASFPNVQSALPASSHAVRLLLVLLLVLFGAVRLQHRRSG